MAEYYVDSINGDDGNSGADWDNAFEHLNTAEDQPIADGGIVYWRGIFPELLTVDVSGSSEIVYQGVISPDTGELPLITGSDDGQSITRDNGIVLPDVRNYRTFRGFQIQAMAAWGIITYTGCDHLVFEDFIVHSTNGAIAVAGNLTNSNIRRLIAYDNDYNNINNYYDGTPYDDANVLVENCLMIGSTVSANVLVTEGGWTVRNCTLLDGYFGVRSLNLNAGQTVDVYQNIIANSYYGFYSDVSGRLTEDYNNVERTHTARVNVAEGAHSTTYPTGLKAPRLIEGFRYSWPFGSLNGQSALKAITGTSEPATDLHGLARVSPSSWGAVQFEATRRDWDAGEPRGRRGT